MERLESARRPHISKAVGNPIHNQNNKAEIEHDSFDDDTGRILNKDQYIQKTPEQWAADTAKKTRDAEIRKREQKSKSTLSEILRLKAEVEEVTSSLRVSEETRTIEEERGVKLKRDLEHRLNKQVSQEAHY